MKKVLLFFGLIIAFFACEDDDDYLQHEFHYKNGTAYPVQIIVYGEDAFVFRGGKNDTISLRPNQDMPAASSSTCVGEFCKGSDTEPYRGLADSARIVFDEKKQLVFMPGQNCNINVLCRDAYTQSKEGEKLIHLYVVEGELYRQAKEIK